MKYSFGKYINFLDSDDKWDKNSLRLTKLFFKFNKNVDIISGRMKYFEKSKRYHFLDYKFNETRVVNLSEEYSYIQLSASSSFFKKSSIKGKQFDENILIGEDVKFINNIILFKPFIGFIKEAIYYYRKRYDFSSAMQTTVKNISFLLSKQNYNQQYYINKSISLYNKIMPFIQFYLAYDILFKMSSPSYKILDSLNYYSYCILIENLIKQIDDKYILEQKILSNSMKVITLSKKYNSDIRYNMKLINKSILFYKNYSLINLGKDRNIIIWKKIEINDNIIHLEGVDRCWFPREKYYYYCQLGKNIYFPN